MGYGSIVSIFDRLSIKTVLSNHTGSFIGFGATLVFIAVCVIILISPVVQYFKGAYFQSQFVSAQYPKNIYTTGDDLVMAMVFRDKVTGQYANHSDILVNINSLAYYMGYGVQYKVDLSGCRGEVFLDAINPRQIKDCIMVPAGLQYNIQPNKAYIPMMQMLLRMKCQDVFKCSTNSPYYAQMQKYIMNLVTNYYYQFIFNSKVLNQKGQIKNQFHSVYSTQYESPDGLGTFFNVQSSQKRYFVDDSILPWWNNRTFVNLFWEGKAVGTDSSASTISTFGFYTMFHVFTDYHYSYRYYKKLDFILGMIGGAVFLLYLLFWIPFSYVNRTLQKMRNAEELLLTKDDILTTQQNLHRVKIPLYYIVTRYLPGNKTNAIVQTAQNQIDIVRLIKKLKVTHRNLRTKGLDVTFKTQDVDLQTAQPQVFIPDRPVLQNYQITLQTYKALTEAQNTSQIYQNNAAVLALMQNNEQKIDAVMQDEIYNKQRTHNRSLKEKIQYYSSEGIKFFDVFGAKPMFNAEPQNSSCWGFFLTLVIIVLSVLTFALTIKNMNSVKIITSEKYQQPTEHNYVMTTGQNFRFAYCFNSPAIKSLTGASKTVQLTFFKQSKKNGYEQLNIQKMNKGQFLDYFQLTTEDPQSSVPAENCFRHSDNQSIPMGGSFQSINQGYFGVRLDPYCSGTPSQCLLRKNKTITDFLTFVNSNTYGIYLSQNKYSPQQGRLISGIATDQVSQSDYVLNASLLRTETIYASAIELLDDTSKSFFRNPPKSLVKTMAFSSFGDRNQQRKGDPSADPGYILQFRPNGQLQQIILRSYKIDFLLGLIGGVFIFWYFIIHFFAKLYNSFKVRAKLAQVLHRQDAYDQSILVQFLYLTKLSFLCCFCSRLKQDVDRVSIVDEKMQRDLDYLKLVKNVDNCYRLSSSLFDGIEKKDLALIYFREKIDQGEMVKPKRIAEVEKEEFEDDEFLEMDDELLGNNQDQTSVMNASNTFLPEASMTGQNIDLDKILSLTKSRECSPLYDSMTPNKMQPFISRALKRLDAFKNPPQLTLDGQRDVKSIIGGVMFFILATLIIIVVYFFLNIYLNGTDFTVSHRRIIDSDLSAINPSDSLGQLQSGISITSGSNFKFGVSFNKKDRYYPHDVSQYIGPIGIRMMQYTIVKENGQINQTFVETELESCKENYLDGFISPYNDPQAFQNLTLGYCLSDNVQLSLSGTPSDTVRRYFKLSIYNKYGNATGRSYLNSFFKIYLVSYYLSVPRMDIFDKQFKYQMTKFNFFTDPYSYPIQQNLTFTKAIFTDKYYSRSRETYNDKSSKNNQRTDINYLSLENTRNLTFYYSGMLDQYTLDYPGGGQLFGLVGGVIVLFIFVVYSCVASFNQYRMKYLIGQRLYTFDKKLSGLTKQKGRKVNLRKIEEAIKKINNFNQIEILFAWALNPIAYIRDNYNFSKTLRRVTLLVDKVENDINLFNVYKNLFAFKNVIDKHVKLTYSQQQSSQVQAQQQQQVNLSSLYIKQIFNPEPIDNHLPIISKESKKHKLSPFEEFKIAKAIEAKVDPQSVLGDKVLNRAFGIDDGSSVLDSRMRMHEEQNQSEEHDQNEEKSKHENKIMNKKKKDKKNTLLENSEAKLAQSDELKDSFSNIKSFEIEESRNI